MKPIEINPVTPTRPIGTDAARPVSTPPSAHAPARASGSGATFSPEPEMVTRSAALAAGTVPPVDADRVAKIRSAVREGSYPLVPASVADAMIAASFLLIEGTRDPS